MAVKGRKNGGPRDREEPLKLLYVAHDDDVINMRNADLKLEKQDVHKCIGALHKGTLLCWVYLVAT